MYCTGTKDAQKWYTMGWNYFRGKLFRRSPLLFLCICVFMKCFHTIYFNQNYLVQTQVSGNKNIDTCPSYYIVGDFNPGNLKMPLQKGFQFILAHISRLSNIMWFGLVGLSIMNSRFLSRILTYFLVGDSWFRLRSFKSINSV